MSKRFMRPDPTVDYSVSKANYKFANYLRHFFRSVSTEVDMNYREFEPKRDKIMDKCHPIDIVLDDEKLPIELLGPPHLKANQERKDERIFKEIERQYRKKPVLIYYNGREPSFKKMREWHKLIQAHLVRNETVVYYEL